MPASSAAATRCGPSMRMRRSARRRRLSRTSFAQRLTWALSLERSIRTLGAQPLPALRSISSTRSTCAAASERLAHVGVGALQALALAVELVKLGALADERRAHGELHGVAVHAIAADAQRPRPSRPSCGEEVLLEEHAHGVEAAPMDLAGPDAAERLEVLGGARSPCAGRSRIADSARAARASRRRARSWRGSRRPRSACGARRHRRSPCAAQPSSAGRRCRRSTPPPGCTPSASHRAAHGEHRGVEDVDAVDLLDAWRAPPPRRWRAP